MLPNLMWWMGSCRTGIILLLGGVSFLATAGTNAASSYGYVINVESSYSKNKIPALDKLGIGNKYVVYSVKVKQKGKTWYKSRLGFFKSRREANNIVNKVRAKHKGAWIDVVKSYDKPQLTAWLAKTSAPVKTRNANATNKAFQDSEKKSKALLEEARVHMAAGRYDQAIRIYSRLLSRGNEKYQKIAQEYLGVAREKNGQYAHAKAEYQEYLRLYPKGEGTERVRQRLAGILTARNRPKRKLAKQKKEREAVWEFFGSLYEFYRFDKRDSNVLNTQTSSLSSNLNLISRRRSDTSDIKMQFSGSYLYDFDDPGNRNDQRISTMFIDMADRPKSMSARIGRQSRNTSGVLGRMDGIWAEYRLAPQWQVNAVFGYPVQTSVTNRIQDNRPFSGVSLDLGTFDNHWDFNLFMINQEFDGISDREAVGGEVRYSSKDQILFTLVDYDQLYKELNKLFFVGTWFFENQKSVNVSLNYGKSPYLLTSNALQGQMYTSIVDMMNTGGYSEEEVRQIARDRTADYKSLTVSGTMPMSKSFNVNGDITVSNLSETPASAGIAATLSTGNEYYYGLQLIGTNIVKQFDTFIIGVKFSDTSSYERNAFFVNERFNLTKKWRLNPKFILENTTRNTGAETVSMRPALKVEYRYKRDIRFEVELQVEKNETTDTVNTSETAYVVNAGLLVDF